MGAKQVTPEKQEAPKPKFRRLLTGTKVPWDEPERDPKLKTILLAAMQGKPMYQGTVSWKEKTDRRRKNKFAKKSRKANR